MSRLGFWLKRLWLNFRLRKRLANFRQVALEAKVNLALMALEEAR